VAVTVTVTVPLIGTVLLLLLLLVVVLLVTKMTSMQYNITAEPTRAILSRWSECETEWQWWHWQPLSVAIPTRW
jgi:type IV secretory pathway VirB3-like protein